MSHKALIAIVGPSGFGKSTSLRNLPTDTTVILDLERKGMPFPNASKFNIKPCANVADVDRELSAALSNKDVTVIVFESLTKYFEMLLRTMQTAYKGYDIWNNYNKAIGTLLDKVKNDHAIVIFTAIDEIISIPDTDGSISAQRRIKVKGKEHEGLIEKEMLMVLFCFVKRTTDGKMLYQFQTNTDGVTSAKTPLAMFDKQFIDNDINSVVEQAKNYYAPQPSVKPTV